MTSEVINIAKKIGARPDYVQGGGGNVSIKLDEKKMAVKASGLLLEELSHDRGLVDVDFHQLRNYYQAGPVSQNLSDLITHNDETVLSCLLPQAGTTTLRPSIETGFHAILDEVVIHTHSVYTNILNCTEEGEDIILELFPEAIFVPYHTPGVTLTYAIKERLKDRTDAVIFLENHGVIVADKSPDLAYHRHEAVNEKIKTFFKLTDPYPNLQITERDGTHSASSSYLEEVAKNDPDLILAFVDKILFPDQAVYGESVKYGKDQESATKIDLDSATILCDLGLNTTRATAETLLAWLYLIQESNQLGLTTKFLSIKEKNTITNLDSEKYRRNII